ncbi:hypothetical protein P154DRAFT_440581 [Amniculicola lignicola CBS 123094]|uniref:Uncharacterized protein n=1 Tax=Amniculicola lignicola CBS 123094 TaxID=1392246 RepID=A0A6A5W8L4_9PLEO|nr:hypothetical protein P154DRAFT_440581 [Amniculicola lignicola CBS 123094]
MSRILKISATAAFSTTAIYSALAWRHISSLDSRNISASNSIPESFRTSRSVKTITNPKNHRSVEDTRSIIVQVPQGLTDEAILAQFVKGFFGGYSFTPESIVLNIIRKDLVKYHALQNPGKTSRIYYPGALNDRTLPPVYTILFGAFQVAECNIHPNIQSIEGRDSQVEVTSSYIDIVYGQDGARLVGVHRFEVSRDPKRDDGAVEIRFSSANCNAKENVIIGAFMGSFHRAYAMLLFREGVLRVLQQPVSE